MYNWEKRDDGAHVTVYTKGHCHERTDIPVCEQGETEEREVVIGDDVWIGSHVIILPGVKNGGMRCWRRLSSYQRYSRLCDWCWESSKSLKNEKNSIQSGSDELN